MSLVLNKVPEHFTSDPYYDMIDGGYYPAESFSDDPETIKKIKNAYDVIEDLAGYLSENELVDE